MEEVFSDEELVFVQKAERFCATTEQCLSSTRAKLMIWGANRELTERILNHLVKNNYLNELRYACEYCRSKIALQRWGRIKIMYQLRAKQIPQAVIEQAFQGIDPTIYHDAMMSLATTKWQQYPAGGDPQKNVHKLVSFLSARGYEMNYIQQHLDDITGKHTTVPND